MLPHIEDEKCMADISIDWRFLPLTDHTPLGSTSAFLLTDNQNAWWWWHHKYIERKGWAKMIQDKIVAELEMCTGYR